MFSAFAEIEAKNKKMPNRVNFIFSLQPNEAVEKPTANFNLN